jgi:hypothetical protein
MSGEGPGFWWPYIPGKPEDAGPQPAGDGNSSMKTLHQYSLPSASSFRAAARVGLNVFWCSGFPLVK